jgi:hypothetical protein
MVKRLFIILAIAASLIACTPAGGGASAGATLAPIGSDAAPSLPTDSAAPSESASPSAS